MATGAAFRVYIRQEKKNMLAEFDQWKKTMENPGRLKKAQKACSAMLASRLHVQLSLRAQNSQVCRSMLGASKIFSPQTVVSGRAGKTLTTETRPAATAPTAREDWRRAFRNILREVSARPQTRGKAIAAACNWRRGGIGGFVDAAFLLEEQNGDFREEMERSRVCEDQGGGSGWRVRQSGPGARFCWRGKPTPP